MRCRKPGMSACSCQLLPLHSPSSSGPLKKDKAKKISPPWHKGRTRAARLSRRIQGAADEFPQTTVEFGHALLFHRARSVSDRDFGAGPGTKTQSTPRARSDAKSGND